MADRAEVPEAEVIISFDMLVYRSGPLVACQIMPDLVAVTTRDDLPAGPHLDTSEDEARAMAKALEAGADTRYQALRSRWRSSHGNDGPLLLWPRKPGSAVPPGPDVVTRLCRVTINGEGTFLVYSGPTPLHFRDNQPLRAMESCGEATCKYTWQVPDEFATAHFWAWADPEDDRSHWPPLDGQSPPPAPDRVFTIAQAAEYLGLTPKTLYNWRTQGDRDQPPSKLIEGAIVYQQSDLDEWLRRSG